MERIAPRLLSLFNTHIERLVRAKGAERLKPEELVRGIAAIPRTPAIGGAIIHRAATSYLADYYERRPS